jgi:hypothetical protein
MWIRIRNTVMWIRIRKDPHHFGNLDPHPDPHPHQIKIRIRIKIFKLDPELHQFADVKRKCMEYEPILALFQEFEHFFKARIWMRIRIRVKVGSGSSSASGSASNKKSESLQHCWNVLFLPRNVILSVFMLKLE